MVRRTLVAAVALLLMTILFIGTAAAQQSPPEVLPDEETPTTLAPPPTPAVTPDRPEVAGDVVTRRPLPRTGGDLSGAALFGGALTITGVAFAATARHRRNSYAQSGVEA